MASSDMAQPGGYRFASPAEAVAAVQAELPVLSIEELPLAATAGRVLAEALHANRASPALDVSAMDGIAVRGADLAALASPAGIVLCDTKVCEARIGRPPVKQPPGPGAVRISTGAPLPDGADTVVRIEDVEIEGQHGRLRANAKVMAGDFVRRSGENVVIGAEIVPPGGLISAAVAGAAAACGCAALRVRRRVRVALLSTGDELVPTDVSPQPWQLHDSNGPALKALLAQRAWIEIGASAHVPDQMDGPSGLAAVLAQAVSESDAVILSGGVSMGQRDFVPAAVAAIGGRVLFHKLPQRPGKPMLAAVKTEPDGARKLILGLPGNPVSVLATARRLAIPMLGRLAGLSDVSLAAPLRTLADPDVSKLDLWWHRLVREEPDGAGHLLLRRIATRSSGDLMSAALSDGLIELPPNASGPGPWPYYAWNS